MTHVSVEDLQQNLIVYLQRVEAGETLMIVQAGHPVIEMKPVPTGGAALRPFGLCAGEFAVPEAFDSPLPPRFASLGELSGAHQCAQSS